MDWLSAFLVTQLVEVPLYLHVLPRGRAGTRAPWVHRVLVAFGASALTHPVVWFVFPAIGPDDYVLMVAAAELFAVLVEALYLARFGVPRPGLASLLANGASLGFGLGSRALFGWP